MKLGGGREGLAGREWEEFMPPVIWWAKKEGRVKGEEVEGAWRENLDSMDKSLRLALLCIGWWVGEGGALLRKQQQQQ